MDIAVTLLDSSPVIECLIDAGAEIDRPKFEVVRSHQTHYTFIKYFFLACRSLPSILLAL